MLMQDWALVAVLSFVIGVVCLVSVSAYAAYREYHKKQK